MIFIKRKIILILGTVENTFHIEMYEVYSDENELLHLGCHKLNNTIN